MDCMVLPEIRTYNQPFRRNAPVNQIANNNGGVSKMQDFWHTAEILAHMERMLPECFSCRSNILIDSIYNLLTPHG